MLFTVQFGFSFLLHLMGVSKITGTIFFESRLLYWLLLLFAWFYSLNYEKQNLLIWVDKKYPASLYVASIISILMIMFLGSIPISIILSIVGLNHKSDKLQHLNALFKASKMLLAFTAFTAGMVEELVFRGYLQPRIEIITRSPYLAIIISSLLFGLVHIGYGTVMNVAIPLFFGFVFSIYYWKFRNIKVLIVCHLLWDLGTLIMMAKFYK